LDFNLPMAATFSRPRKLESSRELLTKRAVKRRIGQLCRYICERNL
jgi:hypothetical protein